MGYVMKKRDKHSLILSLFSLGNAMQGPFKGKLLGNIAKFT